MKYTITQILGNAAAHVHYHPCSEYQAVFLPSALLEKKRPGDEASWTAAAESYSNLEKAPLQHEVCMQKKTLGKKGLLQHFNNIATRCASQAIYNLS